MKQYAELRAILLKRYGLDIDTARQHFSTRNYAFVFTLDYCAVVIRVSPATLRTREEVLSEFMWVDDMHQFNTHVCQPYTSIQNKLIEEFELAGEPYRATMFRRAEGKIVMEKGWDNQYFYAVGKALGLLHKASADGYEKGFRYKRCNWDERGTMAFDHFRPTLTEEHIKIMKALLAKINRFPKTKESFGLSHGDYWPGNLFTEDKGDSKDIWIIDFDDCAYGYYIYDFVTPLWSWLQSPKFMPEWKRHDLLYQSGMLEEYKRGYCENFDLPQEYWDNLELFMRMRGMEQLMIMLAVRENDIAKNDTVNDTVNKAVGYTVIELDLAAVLAEENYLQVFDDLASGARPEWRCGEADK